MIEGGRVENLIGAGALLLSGWWLCRLSDWLRTSSTCAGKEKPCVGVDHCRVTIEKLDVGKLVQLVKAPSAGAVVTFSGTTRNSFKGKVVTRLEYEAYEPMAVKEMQLICKSIRTRWPDVINIAMEHKIGVCPVMETSVIIAVSSGHREAALESAAYAINTLKETVPVWKKEWYADAEPALWKENQEFLNKTIQS